LTGEPKVVSFSIGGEQHVNQISISILAARVLVAFPGLLYRLLLVLFGTMVLLVLVAKVYNDGLKGSLMEFFAIVLFLGAANGLFVEPFMRWVGHPPNGPQPVWVTILCATVLSISFLREVIRRRKKQD
jgi:hypothetical protein